MSGADFPMRDATVSLERLIELYMASYTGRDTTRTQRLDWWRAALGTLTLADVSDDHVHAALERLASNPPRYYAGKDADGQPIYKAKKARLAPATINRYATALAAVFTWAVRRRIAPKGWVHPSRAIERQPENAKVTG